LLEELPVSAEVRSAILGFEGPAGRILENVVLRERGSSDLTEDEQAKLTQAWLEAIEWAERAKPQKSRRAPARA
jgi:c-di-GMP-related signal transduction protein